MRCQGVWGGSRYQLAHGFPAQVVPDDGQMFFHRFGIGVEQGGSSGLATSRSSCVSSTIRCASKPHSEGVEDYGSRLSISRIIDSSIIASLDAGSVS